MRGRVFISFIDVLVPSRTSVVEVYAREIRPGKPPKINYALHIEKPVVYAVGLHPIEKEEFDREDVRRVVLLAALCEIVYAYSEALKAKSPLLIPNPKTAKSS